MVRAKRVIFIGKANTWKTYSSRSLIDTSPPTHRLSPTLGMEVNVYTSPLGNTYNIWDMSGSYISANAREVSKGNDIIIVFSTTQHDSTQWDGLNTYHMGPIVHYVKNPTLEELIQLLP